MKKKILQIGLGILGFAGIAFLILSLTSMGLPTVINVLSRMVPGELTIVGYEGRFIDSITAKKIDYRHDDIHVVVKDLDLKWRGIRLFTGTVDIQSLNANELIIERFSHTDDTEQTESAAFELEHMRSRFFTFLIDEFNIETVRLNDPELEISNLHATLALNEHGLRLRNLHLSYPKGTLALQGNIGPEFDPPIRLLSTQQFSFDDSTSISGETQIEGDFIHLEGKHIFTDGLTAHLDVTADNIGPAFILTAKGQADIDSLHRFEEHLTGEMHVSLDFNYDHTQGQGHVLLKSDHSRVNGKPFQLNFDGTIQNYQVTWKNNQFTMGRNQLITSGEYGPELTRVSWVIAANQLADISDDMSGQLNSKGQYEFDGKDWSAKLQLSAAQLHVGSYAVEKIDVQPSTFGSPMKHPLNLQGEADQMMLDDLLIDHLAIKASGTTENHAASFSGHAYDTALEFSGKMKRSDPLSYLLMLQQLSVEFADKSRYSLDKTAYIEWTNNILKINPNLCLKNDGLSSLCIDNPTPNAFNIHLLNIPNQLFGRYITPRFKFTGNLKADADLTLEGLALQTLNLKADISPMEIRRGKKADRKFFEIGGSTFDLTLDQQSLKSSGHIGLINPDRFDWTLSVQDWRDMTLATLVAEFKGEITQWDPLRLYITDTNDFSGKINLDLKAQGKVLSPTYQGALTLTDARLAIPSHGLILQEGQLKITPSKTEQQLNIEGSLRSGQGVIKADGTLLLEDRWPALDLKINGENFTLSNTSNAIVFASPNLHIQTEETLVDITGELHIPEAFLNIKGYSSYLAPSPDIIIIQENGRVFTPFYTLNTRVLLSLGDAISLKASHLETGVGGQVQLIKLGDAQLRATGQLKGIQGKYAAYGQKLDLSQAILTFNNSPIDNPAMFIEASRPIQIAQFQNTAYLFADPSPKNQSGNAHEGIVGLRITGTVQNPKYTFFSTPSMSEADQLSYLLTGGPSSQIGSAQAAFMFAALTETSGMLGVSDTDAARLQNITRTLGIDFNIQSANHIDSNTGQSVSDTNLVVGKAIHPRLYVSYTVGLLDPLNMFRVRYQLSRHWAVQSQANTQGDSGADIIYGIETDSFLGID